MHFENSWLSDKRLIGSKNNLGKNKSISLIDHESYVIYNDIMD